MNNLIPFPRRASKAEKALARARSGAEVILPIRGEPLNVQVFSDAGHWTVDLWKMDRGTCQRLGAGMSRADPRTLFSLIAEYRASSEFAVLAPKTKADYRRHLSCIEERFGRMPLAALEDRRARGLFKGWRDEMSGSPRQADYRAAVLALVLAHAVDNGRIVHNHAAGLKRLYKADRAHLTWSDADIATVMAHAPPAVANVFLLAIQTGLRQGDLLALTWGQYDGQRITTRTRKTGASAVIPLLPESRAMLDGLPRTSTHILTNQEGRPWSAEGFRTAFGRFKRDRFPTLHFHDTRGTAITRLRLAGCEIPEIGAITGHTERSIETVLRAHYIGDQTPLAERAIARLVNMGGTKLTNR